MASIMGFKEMPTFDYTGTDMQGIIDASKAYNKASNDAQNHNAEAGFNNALVNNLAGKIG
jgi:hypothetical protein